MTINEKKRATTKNPLNFFFCCLFFCCHFMFVCSCLSSVQIKNLNGNENIYVCIWMIKNKQRWLLGCKELRDREQRESLVIIL